MHAEAQIHYCCFLALMAYALYYLGMRTILPPRTPRNIGLNICYGYSPRWVGFLGLMHFLLLATSWWLLLYGPFLKSWSLLISLLLLMLNIKLFLILRDFFCRIYFYKDGLYVVYLDGRMRNYPFENMQKLEEKRLFFTGFFHLVGLGSERAFLFHSSLINSAQLVEYIRSRIFSSQKEIEENT